MTNARPKRIKKNFQSLVIQVPKLRIVSFQQPEDKFNKLKDNNPCAYTQYPTIGWSLFGWIT